MGESHSSLQVTEVGEMVHGTPRLSHELSLSYSIFYSLGLFLFMILVQGQMAASAECLLAGRVLRLVLFVHVWDRGVLDLTYCGASAGLELMEILGVHYHA